MARSRIVPPAVALITAAALVAGCGKSEPEDTPQACLVGAIDYASALAEAPGEVRLEGDTPISDCLVPEQTGGDLVAVGQEMIAAATAINANALRSPDSAFALQLGYLVGAVERGAEGIHADLVRRVEAAARFAPDGQPPAGFEERFARGYAAGLESG
jgi:hypothetical protein